MNTNLFVYGTLMPGKERWLALEPWCRQVPPVEAKVAGVLHRTLYGWPAAVFDPSSTTTIPGVLVRLHGESFESALKVLDDIEGVGAGLFERRVVPTSRGQPAWAYHWPHTTDSFERVLSWP